MRHPFLIKPVVAPLTWLLLAIGVILPTAAMAQAFSLLVTLHDASGQTLTGITILVRDEDGRELARGVSDASGAARFRGLPAVVRVAVEGQARGGPHLYQLGDDAKGVRLDLGQGSGTTALNLRAERDGLVLPDPATMLSLEEGGAVVESAVPVPTALLATPAPLPSTSPSTGVISVGRPIQPAEERRAGWAPLATVLVVALAAGVMRLVQRRRNTP